MTFRACETFLTMRKHKERAHGLQKIQLWQRKNFPSSPWLAVGTTDLKVEHKERWGLWLSLKHMLFVLFCFPSSSVKEQSKGTFRCLGTLAASRDTCNLLLFWILFFWTARLDCVFECALSFMCSTKQCCAEYLWRWTSCECLRTPRPGLSAAKLAACGT